MMSPMSPTKAKPRKTVEDYMRLPEGTRAELIEGEILMSPSPRKHHQNAVLNLGMILKNHARSARAGEVFIAPFDVHLPGDSVVQPDVVFVATPNLAIVRDWIYGAPDLLVEVVSPDGVERDRLVKRRLYAESGVREYWLVDPEERTVEVLTLAGTGWVPQGYFKSTDVLISPTLPGLALPLGDVFA
jgi:Uma2 family endonuclease